MAQEEGEHISGPMTIISIVNGMIGGFILILPVMSLEAGWLLTLIVLMITGFVSYYSCHLCLQHTGNEPDLDVSIMKHFWGKRSFKVFYQLCIISALVLLDILYYELIVLQWIGLAPPHQYTPLNPLFNAVLLLIIVVIIKFKDLGVSLMAYGIVSIVAYLLFITWVVGSQQPKNDGHSLQLFGGNGIDLASGLGQAFAIQAFFIPVLKKNRKPHKHKLYLLIVFILGTFAYAYIAFMGSYGILHRDFKETDAKTSKTIEGYFQKGTWQVNAIQIIYLVHLYSVFPEYLLLGKKRFFSIFQIQESQVGTINKKQIIYILCVLGLSLGIALYRASIRQIIQLNGAVLGFFFIYCIPVAIHFKCAYMKPDEKLLQQKKQEPHQVQNYAQMIQQKQNKKSGQIQQPQAPAQVLGFPQNKFQVQVQCAHSDDKYSYSTKKQMKTGYSDKQNQKQQGTSSSSQQRCKVPDRVVSTKFKVCELIILGFMLILGLTIMIQGLTAMFKGEVEE